jgi:hypothetical protein
METYGGRDELQMTDRLTVSWRYRSGEGGVLFGSQGALGRSFRVVEDPA